MDRKERKRLELEERERKRWAAKMAQNWLREAEEAERAGMVETAEKALGHALAFEKQAALSLTRTPQ